MRLYVALRESAAQRLFAHVPWLRSQLTAAVEAYAAGIHVDKAKLEELGVAEDRFRAIDDEVKAIVQDAADFAQSSPEPDAAELYTDVLVGG